MKLKLNPLLSILLFVVVTSLLLYLPQSKRLRAKSATPAADAFKSAAIGGKLTFKLLKGGIETIRVHNNSQTFVFKPEITPGGSFFHANTNIGDSIIKKANSTDILVKSAEATWRYTTKTVE